MCFLTSSFMLTFSWLGVQADHPYMPAVFPDRLFPEYFFTRIDLPITEEDACRFYILLN